MPKDLFSNHAKEYAIYRPAYPRELYDFIYRQVNHFDQAWDCGAGNGQVAAVLSDSFKAVCATDISAKQIENAIQKENICYSVSPAERSSFADNSFDLVTVGQAIHWFDLDKFYKECSRVGKSGSLLACFGYSPVRCNDSINRIFDDFYYSTIYSYWEPERRIVEDEYVSMPFPFKKILTANFTIELDWTWREVEGYINTWSAVQKFIRENKSNPVDDLMRLLKPLWGNEGQRVHFPVFLKMGTIK